MKSIKKFLFIMVALAATLAFVSCSNGNGDDSGSSSNNNSGNNNASSNNNNNNSNNNGNNNNSSGNNVARPSVVATYEGDDYDYVLTFFSDNTFIVTTSVFLGEEREYIGGTYEGNPSRNGYIIITITKEMGYSGNLSDLPLAKQKEYEIRISSGMLYLDYLEESFTRQ